MVGEKFEYAGKWLGGPDPEYVVHHMQASAPPAQPKTITVG